MTSGSLVALVVTGLVVLGLVVGTGGSAAEAELPPVANPATTTNAVRTALRRLIEPAPWVAAQRSAAAAGGADGPADHYCVRCRAPLSGCAGPKRPNFPHNYELAGVLFSLELQRRLDAAGSPVRSVVAHPGIASTNLARHAASGKVIHASRPLFNDPATGALSILYAVSQDLPGNSYVGPRGPGGIKGHPVVGKAAAPGRDSGTAQRLWAATEQLLTASSAGNG